MFLQKWSKPLTMAALLVVALLVLPVLWMLLLPELLLVLVVLLLVAALCTAPRWLRRPLPPQAVAAPASTCWPRSSRTSSSSTWRSCVASTPTARAALDLGFRTTIDAESCATRDLPDGKGGTLPALLQATKRGEIFMLDRRTGTPGLRVPTDGSTSEQPATAATAISAQTIST